MRITVLGATGGIGRAVVGELHHRGHAVTAASRSVAPADVPAGVAARKVDLAHTEATRDVCADADVVVMAANVPYDQWATRLTVMVETALDASTAADARFVMIDNLYAFGSPGHPISDGTRAAATGPKGILRRNIAERLLAAHRTGRSRVTIAKCSDYYGPGPEQSSVVNFLGFGRAARGKKPLAFIDAGQPHTFHYVPDVARGVAELVEHAAADGRSWILPAASPVTQQELLELAAVEAGLPPKVGRVGPWALRLAGWFRPELREMREIVPQFDRPYVTVADDFESAFGKIVTTPHEQAVRDTIRALRAAIKSR